MRARNSGRPSRFKTSGGIRGAVIASRRRNQTQDTRAPVRISYHWLSKHDELIEFDGVRSHLPRPVGPGDTCAAFVAVTAPAKAGEYRLAIDLVKEGVTWFSEAGVPWYAVTLTVT